MLKAHPITNVHVQLLMRVVHLIIKRSCHANTITLNEPVCVLCNHQWAWSIHLTRFTTMVVAYFLQLTTSSVVHECLSQLTYFIAKCLLDGTNPVIFFRAEGKGGCCMLWTTKGKIRKIKLCTKAGRDDNRKLG